MTNVADPHPMKYSTTCLPLNTPAAPLSLVGGKGQNLARLAGAGFPVPTGFIVTTDGYNEFIGDAGLTGWMAAQAGAIDAGDPVALTVLSDRLRARLRASKIPDKVAVQVCSAYADLGRPPVAVRSSATAEDLPGMSFAGQQDTFLNVLGDDALLHAVVECWSSLWTARAIAYRARNGIDQSAVSLAVVVQMMIQSDTSGVLFTQGNCIKLGQTHVRLPESGRGAPCGRPSQGITPGTVQIVVRYRKFHTSLATGGRFLGRQKKTIGRGAPCGRPSSAILASELRCVCPASSPPTP